MINEDLQSLNLSENEIDSEEMLLGTNKWEKVTGPLF
jgi:hypothetical protein